MDLFCLFFVLFSFLGCFMGVSSINNIIYYPFYHLTTKIKHKSKKYHLFFLFMKKYHLFFLFMKKYHLFFFLTIKIFY